MAPRHTEFQIWLGRQNNILQNAKLWGISHERGMRNERHRSSEMDSACCEIHITLRSWWSPQIKNNRKPFTTANFKEDPQCTVVLPGTVKPRCPPPTGSTAHPPTLSGAVNCVNGDCFSSWVFPKWALWCRNLIGILFNYSFFFH